MGRRKDTNESNRIAIAVFIVATTLALLTTEIYLPSVLILPVGALLVGLIVTSILAFLFILAKGYELRYRKEELNFIDKYNYVLYNASVRAYAVVIGLIFLGFAYKYLKDLSETGNTIGMVGTVILFVLVIFIINHRDVSDLVAVLTRFLLKRKVKK